MATDASKRCARVVSLHGLRKVSEMDRFVDLHIRTSLAHINRHRFVLLQLLKLRSPMVLDC